MIVKMLQGYTLYHINFYSDFPSTEKSFDGTSPYETTTSMMTTKASTTNYTQAGNIYIAHICNRLVNMNFICEYMF